jgi:serine/threonine protein phosphatase PrpC
MKYSPMYYKKKFVNKNKSTFIKPSSRYIQERKSMRNLMNETNYALTNTANNLGIKKNNGSAIRILKDFYNNNTIDRIGKENNINKNNISAYSTLTENRSFNLNPYSKYLSLIQDNGNQSNNYILGKTELSPINKLNYETKYVKNSHNNNISNDNSVNNYYRNKNLNQIYEYNNLSSNNYLLMNPSINQPHPTLKTRMELNTINGQNQILNNISIPSNYSNLDLPNEYGLNNNLNYNQNLSNSNYGDLSLNYNQIYNQNQINSSVTALEGLNLNNAININNSNYNYNSDIISSGLTSGQMNHPIESDLNNINSPGQNQYSTQMNNQNINNIFQTASNNNNLVTINIDDYINQNLNNQQKKYKRINSLKLEEKDPLNLQKGENQKDLISQNSYKAMNYNNPENLRLTLGSEKLSNPEMENKILSRASQKYSLSHNSTQESCVIKKYAASTRPGNDKTGKTKVNQDSMISSININNIKDFNIFGVLDGHGPSGHYISKFAAQFIQNYIINNPEIKNLTKLDSIYLKLKENNYQIIKQSFTLIDRQLESQSFESLGSGTTCILVVQVGRNVICANVGDSRAVAVFDEDIDNNLSQLNVTPLSIDYKLEIPEERNRIIMAGGAVEQAKNSLGIRMGPLRIFTPGKDYPGLAMSRSIGDLEGKKYGIIAEPGIIEFNVN